MIFREKKSKWRVSSRKSEHMCWENKETMQKDTKLESSRERRCPRILYQEPQQSTIQERVSSQMDRILMGEDDLLEWMTYGCTVLCQKDPQKGNAADNYRSITCLPLMWKLLTGVIAEEMYNYLEWEKIPLEEHKGYRRGSHGIKDQLLIDNSVLKDCKKRHTNLSMAWIDYIKTHYIVPHSWINECMEMSGIA